VLALPMTRGEEAFRQAGARVGAVACLALVAALVLGWTQLVPVAVALAGGLYAVELAIADAPLDVVTPAVAAGLFLCAELAYWSLEERQRWIGDTGDGLKRAAVVALFGAASFLVGAVLLVLVDVVRARGLAFDLLGAAAAAAAIATLLVAARSNRQPSSGA
jgi:hypothetical protein